MKLSEDRKTKIWESACGKGNKGFWKAMKKLTNGNAPKKKQKTIFFL